MSGADAVIDMPTDLRDELEAVPLHDFSTEAELDPQPPSKPQRRGALHLTVDAPSSAVSQKLVRSRPPPRWKSPEFIFYGVCFMLVVPMMVWKPIDLSRGECNSNVLLR